MEAEYGASVPLGFAHVTLHDDDGKVIEIPTCPKCNESMQAMIGKEAMCWICFQCPNE